MTVLLSALLEMTVTASVMTGVVLAIRFGLSKKMNPAVMVALWALVLLRLCLPFTIASPVHLDGLMPKQAAVEQAKTETPASTLPPVSKTPVAQAPQGVSTAFTPQIEKPAAAQPVVQPSVFKTMGELLAGVSIWDMLTGIWAAGALSVLLWTARTARRFRLKLRVCRPVAEEGILRIIRHYEKSLGIRRSIPALECNFVEVPAVFGCFRPAILLPAQFVHRMDRRRLNSILLHEICHIKRRDMLLNTIWLFAKAVHWFNPLVWAAYRFFQGDVELSRDQMVIRRLEGGSRLDYGQSLIDSARYSKRARTPLPFGAASLFESKSKVKDRVVRLVMPQKRSRASLAVSAALALLMLVACFTTACQPTPTEEYVKNKKDDSFLNQLITPGSTAGNGGSPAASGATVAPGANIFKDYAKNWTATIAVKPHPITVTIDADVETPAAAGLPVYTVEPEKLTQERIDGFLSQFGDVQYHLDMSDIKTKSYYQELILQDQALLAKLPDNKEYTEAQRKQQKKELESAIKFLQKAILTAPDGTDDVIEPKFTNKYIIMRDSDSEPSIDENGNLETPPPGAMTAKEHYESTHTEAIAVKWAYDGASMSLYATRSDDLTFNGFSFAAVRGGASLPSNPAAALAAVSASTNVVANTGDLKGLRTTYAQARALAEDAVAKLGIDYMTIAQSAKEIQYADLRNAVNYRDTSAGFTDFRKLDYTDVDYVFYFTRNVGGVNETYCSDVIGYRGQYDEPWPYERLTVVVDDTGVRQIGWSGGTKPGRQLASNSKLLPFDEIRKIAERQFTDGNIRIYGYTHEEDAAAFYKNLVKMEVNIDRVVLGYARIKLSDNSGGYALVPAWDFFGHDAYYDDADPNQPSRIKYSMEDAYSYGHSYLTINAIDGSVINRGLGY